MNQVIQKSVTFASVITTATAPTTAESGKQWAKIARKMKSKNEIREFVIEMKTESGVVSTSQVMDEATARSKFEAVFADLKAQGCRMEREGDWFKMIESGLEFTLKNRL